MAKAIALLFLWYMRWVVYAVPVRAVFGLCRIMGRPLSKAGGGRAMAGELKALLPHKGEAEIRGIMGSAYASMLMDEEERLFFDMKKRILSIVRFEGEENLQAALSKGRGAVLALMHFGDHLLIIPALGYSGYPVYQLAEAGPSEDGPNRIGLVPRLLRRRRRQIGDRMPAKIIIADKMSKRVYEVLKNNGVLLCAVDGRLGMNMRPYGFLGRQMLLSNGIFRIAETARSPIMPLFIYRNADGTNTLKIGSPIEFKAPDEGVRKFLGIFEAYFLKYPHHYAPNLMFERRRSDAGGANPLFLDHREGILGHEGAH